MAQLVTNPPGCRTSRFDPWVGKIPWRRKWLPTPVFLAGKSLGQRSLEDHSPWGRKCQTWHQTTTSCLQPSPLHPFNVAGSRLQGGRRCLLLCSGHYTLVPPKAGRKKKKGQLLSSLFDKCQQWIGITQVPKWVFPTECVSLDVVPPSPLGLCCPDRTPDGSWFCWKARRERCLRWQRKQGFLWTA